MLKLGLLVSLSLIACGHKSNSSDVAAGLDPTGTWTTACFDTSGSPSKAQVIYTKTTVEFQSQIFADTSCSALQVTFKETKSLTIGATAEGLTATNSTLLTDTAAFFKEQVAEANKAGIYGYKDWAEGVFKDISGKQATSTGATEAAIGTITYAVIKIKGNTLYPPLKSSGDGKTEATRPTEVDTTSPFTKQ